MLRATTACAFSTCQLPKVVRAWRVLYILTSKRASRHNGVHFFDISTKVVRTWCVLCILTSKCALRHNNFQECSDILTWKCVSRHSGAHFFDISASKSAPRLRCFVHVDLEMCFAPQWRATFHLSSGQMARHPPLLRAYFSTLQSHKSLEKRSFSRLSYLFAHLDLFSSETFSSLIFFFFSSLTLPISAFHLPILSEV